MDIVIVDDDKYFSNQFSILINNHISNILESYNLTIINDDFVNTLLNNAYDIIFLDIDLNDVTGIKLASVLKRQKPNAIIIFVSSRNDLVFDSLAVQPFQFIRKSNLLEDTMLVLNMLNDYLKRNRKLITINMSGRKLGITINDILYLESSGHDVSIATIDTIYTYRCTMKEMVKEINSNAFIQIKKSLIINFDHVKEIDENNNVILKNDIQFFISRFYKKDVLKKYEAYLLLWYKLF